MVSSVRFPFLSGFPAIFQVFFAVLTSFPHFGHFAIIIPLMPLYHISNNKTLSNIKEYTGDLNLGQIEMSPKHSLFS
jgi:hypothetical protein